MLDLLAKPFGVLLLWLYTITLNYGVAIILFAIIVKLILLPFMMKSKRGSLRMSRLSGKMQEIQRRHEGNQKKYQEEMQKLYRDEGVNPMSGCLWMLVPYPILLALYRAIRFPLTVMMGVPEELLAEGGSIAAKLAETGFVTKLNAAYMQLAQSQWISEHWEAFQGLSDKLVQINYKFLGVNLGQLPKWNFFSQVDWSTPASWLPELGLFMIPVISAVMSWASMKIATATNPVSQTGNAQQQAQQQASMQSMNIMMPLMSLYFCFIMPAALGIYWIANSVLAIIQDVILNKYYKKILDAEDAERLEKEKIREAELERKREETERLRAEGGTQANTSTSKKKQRAQERQEYETVRANAKRLEQAERRKRQGIVPLEKENPSRVGDRPYARGRNYDPNRFVRNKKKRAKIQAEANSRRDRARYNEDLDNLDDLDDELDGELDLDDILLDTDAELDSAYSGVDEEDEE